MNPAPGAVVVHTYPSEWVRRFSDAALHEIDPVMLYADSAPAPFFWNDPEFQVGLTASQRKILAAASTRGLAGGYTIPICLSWVPGTLRASCSLVPDKAPISRNSCVVAQWLANYLYAAAIGLHMPAWNVAAPVVFTSRQREVLELVAQGKSDWAIGRLLGVSKDAVHQRIERIMRRTGVTQRTQAVIYAVLTRQISFGGVVRVEPNRFLPGHRRPVALAQRPDGTG